MDALIKILIVFAVMLGLTRWRIHMGLSLFGGGVALCLWAGRGLSTVLGDIYGALLAAELWLLLLITLLIFEFGRHMAEERNARVIMGWARAWGGRHGRAVSLMAIPSVIGLVPMPGGALFSAPLVDQTASESSWDPAWKSAVNYWFRHTWEYWWPVFPVVIVTLTIFDMEIGRFIAMQLPLSLTSLGVGYGWLIRPHLGRLAVSDSVGDLSVRAAVRVAAPLVGVVLCTVLLPTVLGRVLPAFSSQTRTLLAMMIGLVAGLILILLDARSTTLRDLFVRLTDRKAWDLIGTIAGVILFKNLIAQSELVPVAGAQLIESGIPLSAIAALVPFVAGFVTGIAIGFAGIAFPLLVGLADSPGAGVSSASLLFLGFASGYAGMMLSPVHLCFILSRGYFSAPLKGLYRYILPCTGMTFIVAVVLYAIRLLMGI